MSVIAPNMSGMAEVTPARSMHLVELAPDFAKQHPAAGQGFPAAEPARPDHEVMMTAGIRLWPPVADGIEPGAASGRICMDESPSGSGFASHGCSSVDRTLPMLRFVSRRTDSRSKIPGGSSRHERLPANWRLIGFF